MELIHSTKQKLSFGIFRILENFPKKQIGPFMSECLVTGFTQPDGSIILAIPDQKAVNGSRLA